MITKGNEKSVFADIPSIGDFGECVVEAKPPQLVYPEKKYEIYQHSY